MKTLIWLVIAVHVAAGIWGSAEARTDLAEQKRPATIADDQIVLGRATAVGDSFFNDLHIGALWFPSISNKGYVGYYAISGFYPGGGDQSTVWTAGMWAGGYVEGQSGAWMFDGAYGHGSDPSRYDTLDEQAVVETESDLGFPYPFRRLTVHVNTADKPCETWDGDMGMDVTFEWHQWGVSGYDHWVFVHVRIEFTKAIEDFYWAWLSDCDVGNVDVTNYYFDDYAGWDSTLKFCYMRDWDYDPVIGQPPAPSTEDSVFLSPDVVGQYLLAAPPVGGPITADPDRAQKWVTKNYWDWNNDVASAQDAYDRMAGIWENPFPPAGAYDYRILNGVGPYDVSAGDTAHFWMAYVVGEGYYEHSHELYDLGTLVQHVFDARAFFNSGMAIPASAVPPRAPDLDPDLDADITGDIVRIHWAPYENIPGGATADSFIVYASTAGKLGPWESVGRFDYSVTETDFALGTTCTYFWVEAYDTGNERGSNRYALTSHLYERDYSGAVRADENSLICVASPFAGVKPERPANDILIANHPNPFGPATTISYSISRPVDVRLRIYDVSGSLVRTLVDEPKIVGEYRLYWDGRDGRAMEVPPGVYFLRLEAGDQVRTRTVVLVK
jgi:hypothetical protein